MMKRIRLFVAGAALVFTMGGALVPAVATAAAPSAQSTVCSTLGSNSNCTATPSGQVSLNQVIKVVIDILSVIVGVAAVIMIMIGGFRYITAAGDSNNITGAKNTILYALIGLAIVALAQAIVKFVLNKVTQ